MARGGRFLVLATVVALTFKPASVLPRSCANHLTSEGEQLAFTALTGTASPAFARRSRGGPTTKMGAGADSQVAIAEPLLRVGHGFDIHRMAPHEDAEVGGPVVIGGVTFSDFDLGIVAHSDGDVVYHSIVDAVFGALGLPDIGQYFPDSDPRWKGAPSKVFMAEAWKQMDDRGYRIGNVDVTIIAQAPRMMDKNHPEAKPGKPFDHKLAMEDNIADLMKCDRNRVNVKARTHENVDAVGEKRA
eukprot:CAMPEP_0178417596 /NCGR_PEP_ID=MMETSP0689_2-20121128/24653_1 /TAXON_ID=160604 /ORGANISM="Amphidinium massartii, Strain CS-259" /LENGTH=243 /DNA_ID=CAMNT_0020038961 /DNA_START=1 /DNA_END=728 /DNA_ORIENTATION=-